MRWQAGLVSVVIAWWLVSAALSEDKESLEQKLTDELSKAVKNESESAVSEYIGAFPNVFQLHEAAKSLTDRFSDVATVTFLQKVAHARDVSQEGRAAQMVAYIGLALLSEKQETREFLKADVGDKNTLRSNSAFAGISYLSTKDARLISESIVSDGEQLWQTRIQYLFLLRAVGDQGTIEKLEKIVRAKDSPREMEVRNRTAWFIKQRLDLGSSEEQDRWARQELVFLQAGRWTPGFRSGSRELAWTADQIHRREPNVSIALLKARLSLDPSRTSAADFNVSYEIPLAAELARIQKNAEAVPLLEAWAATDFGYINGICREAARQLRGQKDD